MDDSYYSLHTVNRLIFELDTSEGDRLCTLLDKLNDNMIMPNGTNPDPMFVNFTDRSGSDVRIRAGHIEAFFTSTPASRAKDEEAKARTQWESGS